MPTVSIDGLCLRSRRVVPRFEDNRNLLEPFMAVLLDLGRLPAVEEFPRADVLIERFGSLKRALAFVERDTGTEEWKEAARRARRSPGLSGAQSIPQAT